MCEEVKLEDTLERRNRKAFLKWDGVKWVQSDKTAYHVVRKHNPARRQDQDRKTLDFIETGMGSYEVQRSWSGRGLGCFLKVDTFHSVVN